MKPIYALLLLLFIPCFIQGQIITTIAGGGSSTANGIPAITASLGTPQAMVRDKAGNIYYTDALGHKIRQISASGIIKTVIGTGSKGFGGDGGPATLALINQPCGITIDEADNIYFVDEGNNRVRKLAASTGIITTIAGKNYGGFDGDGGPASAAALNLPFDVLYHDGDLFIADELNYRIRKIDKSGIITTFAGTGIKGHTGDGGSVASATLDPHALAMDASGNLFFNDAYQMIRKIDTKGIITTIAGNMDSYTYNGDERPATSATIIVTTLAFNYAGELFFGEGSNNRVRKIDKSGYIHTAAGNGTDGFSGDGGDATKASIDRPCGLLFDTCENLLICNVSGSRIRKVSFNPLCWRLGVEEQEPQATAMRVYPTPAADELHVDNAPAGSYSIVNTAGQVVLQGRLRNNVSNVIAVRNVAAGMYLLVTTNDQTGARTVQKIIKE